MVAVLNAPVVRQAIPEAQRRQLITTFAVNRMKRAEEKSIFPAWSSDFEDLSAADFHRMLQRQYEMEVAKDIDEQEPIRPSRSRIRHS